MGPPGREAEVGDVATSIRASSRASSGDDTIPFDHERFARMRAHAAFVPTLVLERLAADPRAPAEPYETSFPAAVMFVDIAGYVRLSGATHRSVARRETRLEVQSRASRRKSSGRWRRLASGDAHPDAHVAGLAGEAMRDVVSACFAAIVEIVSLHGGDVVKFAGDALFIAWPAGKDRRADARARRRRGRDARRTRRRARRAIVEKTIVFGRRLRRNPGRDRASRGAVRFGDPGERTRRAETARAEARDRRRARERTPRGRSG